MCEEIGLAGSISRGLEVTWATVGAITGARANALRTINEIVMRGGRAWAGGEVTNTGPTQGQAA